MAMLNYATWLQRAVEFTQGLSRLPGPVKLVAQVAAPLSAKEVRDLENSCRLPIPESLQRFWSEASAHCHCTYLWDTPEELHHQLAVAFARSSQSHVWGGVEFESARGVVQLTEDSLDAVELFREDFPKDARFWEHSLPLIPVGNGDYVGLYVRDIQDDPPVVYLCHDGYGGSGVLAPSLGDFLTRWERLCYVAIDLLCSFVNVKTGYVDPDNFPVETEAVRSLFRGEVRPDLVKPPPVMTENDWVSSRDPDVMLKWLEREGNFDDRKLRLFCCACCRRVWNQMGPSSRKAVEVTERFADGLASRAELDQARTALCAGDWGSQVQQDMFPVAAYRELLADPTTVAPGSPLSDVLQRFSVAINESMAFSRSQGKMHRLAYSAVDASWLVSWEITNHLDEPELTVERTTYADLIRHIFGNPFRSGVRPDIIGHATIAQMAKRLYEGEGSAAELHEALRNADEQDLAEHFVREDHPKGCWALDAILRK